MPGNIPAREEINVHNSLDEICAAKHFLGKDLIESEKLFRENFTCYQEDLMWMGVKAFCYYVDSAISYLSSRDSDDFDVGCFCNLVEHRVKHEGSMGTQHFRNKYCRAAQKQPFNSRLLFLRSLQRQSAMSPSSFAFGSWNRSPVDAVQIATIINELSTIDWVVFVQGPPKRDCPCCEGELVVVSQAERPKWRELFYGPTATGPDQPRVTSPQLAVDTNRKKQPNPY